MNNNLLHRNEQIILNYKEKIFFFSKLQRHIKFKVSVKSDYLFMKN